MKTSLLYFVACVLEINLGLPGRGVAWMFEDLRVGEDLLIIMQGSKCKWCKMGGWVDCFIRFFVWRVLDSCRPVLMISHV